MKYFKTGCYSLILSAVTLLGAGCVSEYSFSPIPIAVNSENYPVTPPAPPPGATSVSLQSFKPAFAVRALDCMMCHGVIGANVVTDFGYGSSNFNPASYADTTQSFYNHRTAYNDHWDHEYEGAWESALISGTVIIPKQTMSPELALILTGQNKSMSLKELVQFTNPTTNKVMVSQANVHPAPGQPLVKEVKNIAISYPTEDEIKALLPPSVTAPVAVTSIGVPGVSKTEMKGLDLDPSKKFVRNTAPTVTCYGDVVVKGALFLKNLNLITDANGCRLYVAGTVFIQGPITYIGADSARQNLQISSSRAILMGMSATEMGAINNGGTSQITPAGQTNPSPVRVQQEGTNLVNEACCVRFSTTDDQWYNPSGDKINGVDSSTFFDNLVLDALLIGNELLDAADAMSIKAPLPAGAVLDSKGTRLSINYHGLLLNAPHVHSRYAGSFKGVVIAEVAMFARNTIGVSVENLNSSLEQYFYDDLFNNPGLPVLPAIKAPLNIDDSE